MDHYCIRRDRVSSNYQCGLCRVSTQNKQPKIGLTSKWKVKGNFILTKGSLIGNIAKITITLINVETGRFVLTNPGLPGIFRLVMNCNIPGLDGVAVLP